MKMQLRASHRWLLVAVLTMVCSGVAIAAASPNTVLGQLQQNPNTRIIATGLSLYPQYSTLLANPNLVGTFFATNDAATTKLLNLVGFKVGAGVDGQLSKILNYHIVQDRALPLTPSLHGKSIATFGGAKLIVDMKAGPRPIIRGRNSAAVVIQANITAGKSFLHIIDNGLLPYNPVKVTHASLTAAITANAQLSTFLAAVRRVGLVSTINSGSKTVFAPSNAAMAAALTALKYTSVNNVPLATLQQLVKYHICPGYFTSFNLWTGQTLSTLLTGQKLTVKYTGTSPTLNLKGYRSTGGVVRANTFARTESVLHMVNKVLLPKF